MANVNNPDSDSYQNNEWLQIVYPIGSVYISASDIPPHELFGFGTWEQIKDTFLLCAGDNYAAGSVGGEANHTLTVDEMPTHSHTFQRHMLNKDDDGTNTGESGYGVTNKTIAIYETATGNAGGSQEHNNMPPYLTVYAWKRVS